MKQMGKKIITGILITTMAFMTVGCGSQTEPEDTTEDIVAKVSTEADKEVVSNPVTISIEQERFNVAFYLEAGESKSLAVDTDYEGKLEYTSSNDSVATIDENGKVTAVKNGTATMTVIAGDSKRTVNVIVRTPVAEEEPEEEPDSTETASNETTTAGTTGTGSQSTGSSTTANVGAGTSSGNNTTSGNNATSGTVTGSGNTTPSAPAETTTEASTTETRIYFDWYYIESQVNAKLQADYPNGYPGATTWSSYGEGDRDGYTESIWTNESKINDIYSSIKRNQSDIDSSYNGCFGGMVLDGIEVQEDGTRIIYYTLYY